MIIKGDCLTKLKEIPDESIDCVMTSPPYWALRDYGVEGQLGLEPTFDEYINKLCDIFDEVKRVLKKSGTCWVNLGDSYGKGEEGKAKQIKSLEHKKSVKGYQKCLLGIPFRFAIEMVNRGWILRNNIIWYKPHCMPSSVKDRFTVDFEYLFFFVKNKKYYFETQYEPYSKATMDDSRFNPGTKEHHSYNWKADGKDDDLSIKVQRGGFKQGDEKGRNKRTVWTINPKPYKEAHFAVYPEELCETPIKAGCPKFVCVNCGSPKILDYELDKEDKGFEGRPDNNNYEEKSTMNNPSLWKKGTVWAKEKVFKGYKPTCECNAGFTGGIVLDPFFGSGTTGLVALKQNKKFIGIELNQEYIEIANKRLKPFREQRKL